MTIWWLAGLALIVVAIRLVFRSELGAAMTRDPAARNAWEVLLLYPGFHAIVIYRMAHQLWQWKVPFAPRLLSQLGRGLTGVEIHPGAKIGHGLFIDHAVGVVIGETAELGDNVTLFQGVTLGGTGKEKGKRHPTLRNNVVVGAGAKVLGNITLGDNVRVGANAVVIRDVPANAVVVGVPGRVVKHEGRAFPGINLDHTVLPDPLAQALEKLQHEIDLIEDQLKQHRKGTSRSASA